MVLMSIATKTGDDGTTGLMYGRRVSKIHPQVEACGAVDELNCALGTARAQSHGTPLEKTLFGIQKELVNLMGELAVAEEDSERYVADGYERITDAHVAQLTAVIDDLEQNQKLTFKHWATPGFNPASAALDVARTVCRRAEREVIRLRESGETVNPEIIRYLNRLSDFCWLQARWVESQAEPAG